MTVIAFIFIILALVAYFWSLRVMHKRELGESDFKENALFGVFIIFLLCAMIAVAIHTWG